MKVSREIAAHYAKLGRKGSKARNKNLTPERRREIAQCAAIARWRRVAKETAQSTDETPPKDIP